MVGLVKGRVSPPLLYPSHRLVPSCSGGAELVSVPAPPAVIPPAVAPLRVVVGAEFRIPGQRYIYAVTRVSGNPPQAWYCPSHMDRRVERNWRGPWQDLNALSGMIDEMDNVSL